jgi:hypothetical protein
MNALATVVNGRPSILSEDIIGVILKHISVGNYIKPSVEAAGINYSTFRTWIVRGEQDRAAGIESRYSLLTDQLARAQAEAEATIVDELRTSDDWRAKAFIAERRWRDRWGKDEPTNKTSVTVQIPEQLASVLVDVLRVAGATTIQGELVESTSQPADQAELEQSKQDEPSSDS